MKRTQTRADFIGTLDKELISFGVADRSEILSDFELHFADSAAQGLSEAEICEKLGDITEIAAQYGDDYIRPAVAAVKRVEELPKPDGVKEVKIEKTPDIPIISVESEKENPLQLDTFAEIEEIIASAPRHPEAVAPEKIPFDSDNESINENSKNVKESNSNRHDYSKPDNFEFSGNNLIKILIVDILIFSWVLPVVFSFIVALLAVPISLVISGVVTIFGSFYTDSPLFYSPFSEVSTLLLGIMITALGGLATLAAICLIKLLLKIIRGIINWHSMLLIGRKILVKKENA